MSLLSSDPSTHTRLIALNKGKFDPRSFGVYIGGRMVLKNGQYLLEESKWANPWEDAMLTPKAEGLRKYREKVLSSAHLRNSLSELEGKVLGHFFEGNPKENSHGSVLIDLLRRKKAGQLTIDLNVGKELWGQQVVFFEPYSVLDNETSSNWLTLDEHGFLSASHVFAYLMAVETQQPDVIQECLRCHDLNMATLLSRKVLCPRSPDTEPDVCMLILNMLRSLHLKYQQDAQFRDTCKLRARPQSHEMQRTPIFKFVQCSGGGGNKFWTCGKKTSDIVRQDLGELPGLNIMGWCLCFVNQYQMTQELSMEAARDGRVRAENVLAMSFGYALDQLKKELKQAKGIAIMKCSPLLDPVYQGLELVICCLEKTKHLFTADDNNAWLKPGVLFYNSPNQTNTVPSTASVPPTKSSAHSNNQGNWTTADLDSQLLNMRRKANNHQQIQDEYVSSSSSPSRSGI